MDKRKGALLAAQWEVCRDLDFYSNDRHHSILGTGNFLQNMDMEADAANSMSQLDADIDEYVV